jgi:hypothetical protein
VKYRTKTASETSPPTALASERVTVPEALFVMTASALNGTDNIPPMIAIIMVSIRIATNRMATP